MDKKTEFRNETNILKSNHINKCPHLLHRLFEDKENETI